MVGSAKIIEHDTPLPEHTGFSVTSCPPVFEILTTSPLKLLLLSAHWVQLTRLGVDIVESSTLLNPPPLENIIEGPAPGPEKEVLDNPVVLGLLDLVELTPTDVVVEVFEEHEEKTESNTHFAFFREANFLSSIRKQKGFLGFGLGNIGLRSKETKPAVTLFICME